MSLVSCWICMLLPHFHLVVGPWCSILHVINGLWLENENCHFPAKLTRAVNSSSEQSNGGGGESTLFIGTLDTLGSSATELLCWQFNSRSTQMPMNGWFQPSLWTQIHKVVIRPSDCFGGCCLRWSELPLAIMFEGTQMALVWGKTHSVSSMKRFHLFICRLGSIFWVRCNDSNPSKPILASCLWVAEQWHFLFI